MAHFESDRGQHDRDQSSDAGSGDRRHQPALPVPGRVSEDRSRLPSLLRTKMERAFGTDFSDVRIHEGSHAQAMGAVAYARGNDLYFQPGRYDPESDAGQRLLGHELAHVVQQRNGRVKAQGEDSPLNEDPALEAEAEEMGARAASGQGTGMSAPAGRASGDAVQLYKEMQVGGEPWRLSEGNRVLSKTTGSPGSRTKFLWADPALVVQANQALITAGSFIRLDSDGDTKDVIVRDGGRNATLESEVKIEAQKLGGEDQQASYFQALNRQLEQHEPSGVKERAHDLAGGRQHPVPKEQMESEYFEALNQRRQEARQTDRTVSLPKVIPRFEPSVAPKTPTYRAMKDLQGKGGLYTPSDCNEAARVIMGATESMRNERPVVGTGGAPQPRAIRDIGFGKQGGCGTIAEKGGLTGIADAMHAYAQVVGTRELPQEQVLFFRGQYQQLENEAVGLRVVRALKEQAPAVYADFAGFAKIDEEAQPEIGDALVTFRLEKSGMDPSRNHRLYLKLVQALTQILKVDEPRARDILRENGLRENTIDFNTSGAIDQLVKWLQEPKNHEDAEEREKAAERAPELGKENELWNKHWGGVVMQDSGDFVTLENDSGTANSKSSVEVGEDKIVINQEWGFAMYGTAKKEQTFHHQMMETEDFGDHATTMNFRRDRSNQQGVQGENEVKNDNDDGGPSVITLTPNEKQVLLYARKLGAKTVPGDLAKAMSSPVMVVLNARKSLLKKLDAYDMAEAIPLAQKLGLLED